ncbi:hypothetical protein V2I01_15725 [Micromonospora sp. BRA006-A]|nr:hypothetical protein [Micromonospora sp. BRA006-A]
MLLRSYQMRLTLYRAPGQAAAPQVRMLGAMASNGRTGSPSRRAGAASPGAPNWPAALLAERPHRRVPRVRRRR